MKFNTQLWTDIVKEYGSDALTKTIINNPLYTVLFDEVIDDTNSFNNAYTNLQKNILDCEKFEPLVYDVDAKILSLVCLIKNLKIEDFFLKDLITGQKAIEALFAGKILKGNYNNITKYYVFVDEKFYDVYSTGTHNIKCEFKDIRTFMEEQFEIVDFIYESPTQNIMSRFRY